MGIDVTLTLKTTCETGREPGERQKSATRVSLVRAYWFLYAGRTDPTSLDKTQLHIDNLIQNSCVTNQLTNKN
jgi:hypothetical protein